MEIVSHINGINLINYHGNQIEISIKIIDGWENDDWREKSGTALRSGLFCVCDLRAT